MTTSQAAHKLLQDENANWSYEGAYALVEYFEEIEEETGKEIELDVVEIRCDWDEYSDEQEAARSYGWEFDGDEDSIDEEDLDYERDKSALEWLSYRTTVIQFKTGIILRAF